MTLNDGPVTVTVRTVCVATVALATVNGCGAEASDIGQCVLNKVSPHNVLTS